MDATGVGVGAQHPAPLRSLSGYTEALWTRRVLTNRRSPGSAYRCAAGGSVPAPHWPCSRTRRSSACCWRAGVRWSDAHLAIRPETRVGGVGDRG
jgi:hypothetical protein